MIELFILLILLVGFVIFIIIGRSIFRALLEGLTMKTCSQCAEKIKVEAIVCRFCNATQPSQSEPDSTTKKSKFKSRELYEKWKEIKTKHLSSG